MEDSVNAFELKLPPLSAPIKKVSCGWTHVVILLEDGKVCSWGRDDYSQLGEVTHDTECPVREVQLTAADIEVGSEHCLAVRSSDKAIMSWGWNEHGNCGNGSVQNVANPTKVVFEKPYNDVISFCSASGHNFAYVMEN